ncbi:hypothetical protein TPHA_0E02030 [Tetrapisispora phaffii CBS 4417]|uniref:Protein-S-isoprenylcysteine O-methyltransferase n=1 Tax=Tetrapisispora phaffii (strain ATCC 24235 / CBS 4417 / NBRC 1672 / NRRL Y-8282 / UCD 70-5) TaxID=1071381 RepID=G8BTR7_TETPH|nr:hypothetical protein TPHA_0E02030 [Tetrapisispora phaffii CBS 4417]CCE63295.1 hypothetical protein TPHA_0E02030 [Tetrapisispora phaffii CBS 4417]
MSDSSKEDIPIIINGKPYPDIVKNPLNEIALTSYILGALFGISLGLIPFVSFRAFNLYLMALSTFHFLEFYITAKYNRGKVHSESFLINNGVEYISAHLVAICECSIERVFFNSAKRSDSSFINSIIFIVGLCLVIIGQVIRSLAMYTAGQSFSHIVKTSKIEDHDLVTDGIYSFFRHPSYFGFFWWAIGTQMMLLNPISFVLFSFVLWRFFSKRINYEEKYLVEFFGKKYLDYKKTVPVRIPFIN